MSDDPPSPRPNGDNRPTLNTAVLRRRADQAFFLRLRQSMVQNQRALERLAR